MADIVANHTERCCSDTTSINNSGSMGRSQRSTGATSG